MSITYNAVLSRYEMDVNGETVFANVRKTGDTLYIDYVEAPPALRGTGAAGQFMQELMMRLAEENSADGKLQVIPICGYAASWMERNPQVGALRNLSRRGQE